MENNNNMTLNADTETTLSPETETSTPTAAHIHKNHTGGRGKLAVCGFIVVVLAWVLMIPAPYVSMGCAVVGLIMSIIGVRIPAGPKRNFAITAIVAGAVLVLVFALFVSLLIIVGPESAKPSATA